MFKQICIVIVLFVSAELSGYCKFGTYEGGPGSSFVGDFEADVLHGDRAKFEGIFVCHKDLDLIGGRVDGTLIFEGQAGQIRGSHIGVLLIRKSGNSTESQVIRLGATSVVDLLQNEVPITLIVEGSDVLIAGKQLSSGTYELAACPITVTVAPRTASAGPVSRREDASFFAKNSEWLIATGIILAVVLNISISRMQAGKPIFGWD